jgi:hypothetical protein
MGIQVVKILCDLLYHSMRSTLSRMPNIASPVAATATKISSTAEEQKEDNDNQEQIHGGPPL